MPRSPAINERVYESGATSFAQSWYLSATISWFPWNDVLHVALVTGPPWVPPTMYAYMIATGSKGKRGGKRGREI